MEIDLRDFEPFYTWIGHAVILALIAVPVLSVVGVIVGYIVSAVRYGPIEGTIAVARGIGTAFAHDFRYFSLRRTVAIARVAMKEAIRRKVLVVFVVFAIMFLFAGFFLDTKSEHPARLYLSFVLTTTTFLVLFLALFVTVFSLPADIAQRTIYTVVTKPVRASEIVLGRIVGFTAIGTLILAGMLVVSYVFVVRGMRHTHAVDGALEATEGPDGKRRWQGITTLDRHHRHKFTIESDGQGSTDIVHQHWHSVRRLEDGTVVFSPPRDHLIARVPKFGRLRFLDREGNPARKGVNVGYVWEYRSYIEGGTEQAAIWTFDNIRERDFPDGRIVLALNLRVFRTYVGEVKKPIRGVLFVEHPDPTKNLRGGPIPFEAKEFQEQLLYLPRKLERYRPTGRSSETLDLFKDLIADGRLVIKIKCDDSAQYFGVAAPDVYIRMPDGYFSVNFLKGFAIIWLQMVTIIALTVMFSTLLKSPVALLATVVTFIVGYQSAFIEKMAKNELYGGGPLEALIRIVRQDNLMVPLELKWPWVEWMIKTLDWVFAQMLYVFAALLPSFKHISQMTEFVAYNYDIPWAIVAKFGVAAIGYLCVFSVLGYFFLKSREVAG